MRRRLEKGTPSFFGWKHPTGANPSGLLNEEIDGEGSRNNQEDRQCGRAKSAAIHCPVGEGASLLRLKSSRDFGY